MASKGSMRAKCKAYKDRNTRELNKIRKIEKHIKKHPNDEAALEALEAAERWRIG